MTKNKCKCCGKQSVREYCARCRNIWKRLIFTPHKHFLPEATQVLMIRKAIKQGMSV